jgi:hypothetical protein
MNAILDEAYSRLSSTGPEWGGNLSNHGPMAAEVLVRRGCADQVPGWVDSYIGRLDEMPAPREKVTDQNWHEALGDFRRIGDWTEYLDGKLQERPWREVLVDWWPRLLPGIVAGATHGVIRTSHAVRALMAGDESPAAFTELAGALDASAALESVPRIPRQDGNLASRFGQLGTLSAFPGSLAALRPATDPEDARARLADLVDAATLKYLTHGHGSPVLLVHTATAPNAVLHTLPVLPTSLWAPSLSAAWAASAAIISTYAPLDGAPRSSLPEAPTDSDPVAEAIDRAASNGDEHVIKFTDTAVEVYERTGDRDALAAAVRVTQLLG